MSSRARAWCRTALGVAFYGTGALALVAAARRRTVGPRVHILGFHRIVDALGGIGPEVIPALCITTASFRRLCEQARRSFELVTLAHAAEVLAGTRPMKSAGRDLLALTFDDGYRDVYLRALPILRELSLPSTVFVPTGYIGSLEALPHDRLHALLERARSARRDLCAAPAPRPVRNLLQQIEVVLYRDGAPAALDLLIDRVPAPTLRKVADAIEDLLGAPVVPDEGARVMSESELRACADGGMELGAHTVDHVVLTREPSARVHRELAQPRRDLEAITGAPCRSFAWCNGLWTPPLVGALRQAGYTAAVTTCDRPNLVHAHADPFLLGRKVLHEEHVRDPFGRYSTSLGATHLHDLLGTLGLTRPVDGLHRGASGAGEEQRWRRSA